MTATALRRIAAAPIVPRLPEIPQRVPLLAVALSLWPVWRWYLSRLDDGTDEPFGLLALAIAAVLLWPERRRLAAAATNATLASAAFLITYASVWHFLTPLPRALFALPAIACAAGFAHAPAGAWGLLVLSLPLMASLQFYLNYPLQKITAHAAALLLSLTSAEVTVAGTVLQWQATPVAVDPPCSGIKMLWAGALAHFTFATRHRLSWKTLVWLSPLAAAGILAANALRAALLFFKESGIVALPEWIHAAIGLAIFALVLLAMSRPYSRLATPRKRSSPVAPAANPARALLFAAAALAALAPLLAGSFSPRAVALSSAKAAAFPGWPARFEGRGLTMRTLSSHETAFAKNFPGRLGVFDDDQGRRIILRWVTAATRKLHSSADCLRATGYAVAALPPTPPDPWRRYAAERSGQRFAVREQIYPAADPARIWTDVSAWFWSASRHPEAGPWWAITVIDSG